MTPTQAAILHRLQIHGDEITAKELVEQFDKLARSIPEHYEALNAKQVQSALDGLLRAGKCRVVGQDDEGHRLWVFVPDVVNKKPETTLF